MTQPANTQRKRAKPKRRVHVYQSILETMCGLQLLDDPPVHQVLRPQYADKATCKRCRRAP